MSVSQLVKLRHVTDVDTVKGYKKYMNVQITRHRWTGPMYDIKCISQPDGSTYLHAASRR